MQAWLCAAATFPHSWQGRRRSCRSKRYRTAASTPSTGSANPIRNQIRKELPLIVPMVPAERPKKNMTTRNSTAPPPLQQPVQRPDDRDDGEHDDDRPEDERHDADHDLEQDPAGDQQDYEGQCLAAEVGKRFAHDSIVAEADRRSQGLSAASQSTCGGRVGA